MKHAILTLIIAFSTTALKANHASQLHLSMIEHAQYEVVFNHQVYGNAGNSFSLNNLVPGRYPLTVAKMLRTHRGLQKKVIYNGFIDIPARSEVNALVDRYNKLQITYRPIPIVNPTVHTPYGPGECVTTTYYEPAPMAMHPGAFNQLVNVVENQWFDSGKLNVVEQAARSNNFTTAQVAQLMRLFSFESSKLQVAKMAFASTIDKQNYFMVNNEFTFSSSVRELDRFIYNM